MRGSTSQERKDRGRMKDFLYEIFLDYRMGKRVQSYHRDCDSSKSVVVQCRRCCLLHALETANTLVLEGCTMTTHDLGVTRQ